jgi:hypothetical protein
LKIKAKSRHFDTIEALEAESQAKLNSLTEQEFQVAFKKWQKLWERCTTSRVAVASGPKVSF